MKKLLLTITLLGCIQSSNAVAKDKQQKLDQQQKSLTYQLDQAISIINATSRLQALQDLYIKSMSPQQTALRNQITKLQNQFNALPRSDIQISILRYIEDAKINQQGY